MIMNIKDFLDKWVYFEEDCCGDIINAEITFNTRFNISILYMEISNTIAGTEGWEEESVQAQERLFNPIVAIQEAQKTFIELQKDFNNLWSKIMESTIPLQGVIG